MWRIKKLTEMFGPVGFGWYYEILEERLEEVSNGEVLAFVKINLFYKLDGEWSMPVQGTGGNKMINKWSKGLTTNDECFKMALTDAISVASKSIGIGAKVYWEKDNTKYSIQENPKSKPAPIKKEESLTPTLMFTTRGQEGFKEITQKQRERLLGIAKSKGLDNKGTKQYMFNLLGIESSKDLDQKTSYDILVKYIEKLPEVVSK